MKRSCWSLPRKDVKCSSTELSKAQGAHEKRMHGIMLSESVFCLSLDNTLVPYSFSLIIGCSNNIAKYEAVISGLESALLVTSLGIYDDSELVVKHYAENTA